MKRILIIGASSATGKGYINNYGYSVGEHFYCDLCDAHENQIKNRWYKIDLSNELDVFALIRDIAPDQIYNFAGTFTNDFTTVFKTNVLLPQYILESVFRLNSAARVLLIGSAAEYGRINENDNPINEECALNPQSVYGLSKVFQTSLMKYYFQSKRTDVVMARTFNLLGNNLSDHLFIGRLYKQISDYKEGKISEIILRNIDNKRDYIDIKKAVAAYSIIMNRGIAGEVYNVGSGISIKISDLLNNILHENGLTMDIVKITESDDRFDVKDIRANINKLKKIC